MPASHDFFGPAAHHTTSAASVVFLSTDSRTAYDDGLGGAHNAHDANYLTFHRIADFRKSLPSPLETERHCAPDMLEAGDGG